MHNIEQVISTFFATNNRFQNNTFPKFSVVQDEGIFEVSYALAGYKKDEIEVEYEKLQIYSMLTVTGKQKDEDVSDTAVVHYNLISKKDFEHSIRFPYNTKIKTCKFEDGMLTVTIEMDEEVIKKNRVTIE